MHKLATDCFTIWYITRKHWTCIQK